MFLEAISSHFLSREMIFAEELLDFDDLDITNEEIDFNELDELIDKFQQDERVKEALLQGVDMRDYGRQVLCEMG